MHEGCEQVKEKLIALLVDKLDESLAFRAAVSLLAFLVYKSHDFFILNRKLKSKLVAVTMRNR